MVMVLLGLSTFASWRVCSFASVRACFVLFRESWLFLLFLEWDLGAWLTGGGDGLALQWSSEGGDGLRASEGAESVPFERVATVLGFSSRESTRLSSWCNKSCVVAFDNQ